MSYSNAKSSNRLRWLARGGLLWALLLVGRLAQLQISEREEYQKLADRQQHRDIVVEAPRGQIVDRNGRLFAISVPAKSIVLRVETVTDIRSVATRIAKVIGVDAAKLEAKIRIAKKKGVEYAELGRRLLPEQVSAVEALHIPEVAFRPDTRRVYPNGTLAANVLGWVYETSLGDIRERAWKKAGNVGKHPAQDDDDELILEGAGGLERAANKDLTGTSGRMEFVVDARNRRADADVTKEPLAGRDLKLTIDARIQHVADNALRRAVQDNHCSTGSVVVMDPNTGEVLAMSSYPSFDPNEPVRNSNMDNRVNQAISNRFEPGSVFKVFTFASALETTGLKPDDIIACGRGVAHLFGRVIHDHDSYDQLTATDVLAKSSNVGTINIALKVGLDRLVHTIGDFGFGTKTGVGLPGEAAGLVPHYKNTSLGYVAIGHEIAVTNMQLARAASAVANGGYLITPRVVAALQRPGGEQELPKEMPRTRIMKGETAVTLRQMMEHVVLAGTGTRAKFAGFTSGGKTGSAQIFDFNTGRYSHTYNSSFMGFAPVTNPNVVVVVTLNGASLFGGVLAAPVFSEIASAAMRVREVHRDVPDLEPIAEAKPDRQLADASATPDRPALSARDLKTDAADAGFIAPANAVGPRVPDFRGKSMTAAVSQSVALGLALDIRGRGLVRNQSPAPGAVLNAGEKVRLVFAP